MGSPASICPRCIGVDLRGSRSQPGSSAGSHLPRIQPGTRSSIVAAQMTRLIRVEDVLARYGGEEEIAKLPRNQRLSLNSVRDLANGLAEVPVVVAVLGMQGRHSTPGGSTSW